MNPIVELINVSKVFRSGEEEVHALRSISLTVERGEFTAIAGPSGSGKTTLLNVISGIEKPDEGKVIFDGQPLNRMDENALSDLRLHRIGFVFQAYNLIPTLTGRENAEFVLFLRGVPEKERRERVEEIFRELGIENLLDRFPHQMSGGQQQRVAIARAIVGEPDIILADEPTANLDTKNSTAIIELMKRLNEEKGITFLFSTHDPLIMENARRIVHLRDGRIVGEERK